MPAKWERCIEKVKQKQLPSCSPKYDKVGYYNPYKICNRLRKDTSEEDMIYTGPRGGKYRIISGKRVYIKQL